MPAGSIQHTLATDERGKEVRAYFGRLPDFLSDDFPLVCFIFLDCLAECHRLHDFANRVRTMSCISVMDDITSSSANSA